MSDNAYDVLVYGPLFCDFIFTGLENMPVLGTEIFAQNFTMTIGGSAIVAAGLQRLGVKVGLVADLGDDPLSQVAAQLLDDLHIDRTFVRQHPHPLTQLTVALSFPNDRAFITRFEKPDTPADLATILRDYTVKHLHIGSFLAVYDAPDATQIAHTAGTTISMDPGWDEVALRDSRVHEMLGDLDYFLPSRSELCYMLDDDDIDSALNTAVTRVTRGSIVVKNGAAGALARGQNIHEAVPSLPVTPVDTTGAGDAFDAGFIYGLVQGYTLNDCMRYGAVCGALTTTGVGGATSTPTLKEVQQWLPKLPL